MYNYPVIIFEGIEASGKSTHIKSVENYLKKIKRKYLKIREPGGTKYSEIIRKLILNKKSKLNYKSDLLLILASRSENIDKLLKKNYKKKIILIDRFTDSTLAYQHYGMKINLSLLKKMNKLIIEDFRPNITFLSVVNKKNRINRIRIRKNINKYDKFNNSFYDKVQRGFVKIAKNSKKHIILDTNKFSINENKKKIINKIKKII